MKKAISKSIVGWREAVPQQESEKGGGRDPFEKETVEEFMRRSLCVSVSSVSGSGVSE